ncbi:MAG: hypothetical protein O7A63_00590, partial [Acidobacteria bacterium]|nr:hypothetical protein [Acidobacteriota bacterium]
MRNLWIGALMAAPAFVVWLLMSSFTGGDADPTDLGKATPAPSGRETGSLLERLTEENTVLRAEIDRLRRTLARPEKPRSKDSTREKIQRAVGLEPRELLDRYVASFEGNPAGSEYLRLGVVSFAAELIGEIAELIGDPAQPLALRLGLMRILAAPEFRGDATATRLLLDVIRPGEPQALVSQAL